jgi:Na+/pantothenate symporter
MNSQITTIDYVLFVLIFLVSIKIGIFYCLLPCFSKLLKKNKPSKKIEITLDDLKHKNFEKAKTAEYLSAAKSLSIFPLTLSLLATMFSSTTLLGYPADIYQYGSQTFVGAFGIIFGPLLGAFVTGPIFHRLNVLSVFEYLELRFDSKHLKALCTIIYIIKSLFFTAIYIIG